MLSGCYGTLGLESGGVADTQLTASSVWEWTSEWAAAGARLKKTGLPWVPSQSDQKQWLQIDLKREKRITGNKNTQSLILLYAEATIVSPVESVSYLHTTQCYICQETT